MSQPLLHATTTTNPPPACNPDSTSTPKHTLPTITSGSWSSDLSPVDIQPFTQPVGPTLQIPETELEVFQLFFTREICSFITEQSNLYAQHHLGEKYKEWTPITAEELRAYFGFMLLMGLYPKPAIGDYWRCDPFVNYVSISDRISRDRFYDIHRYLHFADNALLPVRGDPGYDRLGKVRGILERVQERCQHIYKPHCENSIDEAMIPFQGRSSLKQYMPAKPTKRGIKVWCRADSQNGYLCEFQVYTGRSDASEGALGKRVVLDLSQRLDGMHHHLYFYNFFSSVPLLEMLLKKGTYACGTTRQSYREFPLSLKMKGKSKAEMERHGLHKRYCKFHMHSAEK